MRNSPQAYSPSGFITDITLRTGLASGESEAPYSHFGVITDNTLFSAYTSSGQRQSYSHFGVITDNTPHTGGVTLNISGQLYVVIWPIWYSRAIERGYVPCFYDRDYVRQALGFIWCAVIIVAVHHNIIFKSTNSGIVDVSPIPLKSD